jgi:hypothetical protein
MFGSQGSSVAEPEASQQQAMRRTDARQGRANHTEAVDELDVQGILAFAERILPRASDLWVEASLDYKQRLQALFFPEGIAYDRNRFNQTAATAPPFNDWASSESAEENLVSRVGIEHVGRGRRPKPTCLRLTRRNAIERSEME